jgi:hypothetical protein
VKLLEDVQLRGQSKNLSKPSKFDVKPSSIYHPHKDSLLLVKEESAIELSDDFLIPVVVKQQ